MLVTARTLVFALGLAVSCAACDRRSAALPLPIEPDLLVLDAGTLPVPIADGGSTDATPFELTQPDASGVDAASPRSFLRAFPKPSLDKEASRYGRFEMTCERPSESAQICAVSFVFASGRGVALFSVEGCGDDTGGTPGINLPASSLSSPVVAHDGSELHVFAIAAVRGGNAVPGSEYWGVIVRPGTVWAGKLTEDAELTEMQFLDGPLPTLVLTQPPTTIATGERIELRFGQRQRRTLQKLPRHVVETERRHLSGNLHPSSGRSMGFLPVLWDGDGGSSFVIIDDEGRCTISHEPEAPCEDVEMTVDVQTWDDGRTTIKCVSKRGAIASCRD